MTAIHLRPVMSVHRAIARARRLFVAFRELCFGYKKTTVVVVLLLITVLYNLRDWFAPAPQTVNECTKYVEGHLSQYSRRGDYSNAAVYVLSRHDKFDDPFLVPFVANGQLAIALEPADDSVLHVMENPLTVHDTNVRPVVHVSLIGAEAEATAFITDFANGRVSEIQYFRIHDRCVLVESEFYAHRLRPNVFLQHVMLRNPTMVDVKFRLAREQKTKMKSGGKHLQVLCEQITDFSKPSACCVVLSEADEELSLSPGKTEQRTFVSVVVPFADNDTSGFDKRVASLEEKAIMLYYEAILSSYDSLKKEHVDLWQQIWQSGFEISHSLAPHVLNNDIINATMYVMVSHSPLLWHRSTTASHTVGAFDYEPHHCYSAHNTLLYVSKLWASLTSFSKIRSVVSRWYMTLKERGCNKLLEYGADGMLQAMLLSFGAFKFSMQHLELNIQPAELERECYFRKILLDRSNFLHVWIEIDDDNHLHMYLATESENERSTNYYACDAGCHDEPILIKKTKTELAVKQTVPPTAILYVSQSVHHLQKLKNTIHVVNVFSAPAHDIQRIMLHKHGHSLGGLPPVFWYCLVFLIVVFHLFLVKLIYHEYFHSHVQKPIASRIRGRYAT